MLIAQINPTMFITMSGIAMFLMLLAITIMLLLEMGVTNVGSQKRLVHLFISHPFKVEALVIGSFWSFPIFIVPISILGEDSSMLTLVGTLAIAWPVLSYVLHRRLMDFQQTLGLGKKKEYNPVLVAKLSVTIWAIAACGVVLSFFIAVLEISQELSYLILGVSGIVMFFIPFRESLAIVRNQNTTVDNDIE